MDLLSNCGSVDSSGVIPERCAAIQTDKGGAARLNRTCCHLSAPERNRRKEIKSASRRTSTVPPDGPNSKGPAITNVSEIEILTLTVGSLTGRSPLSTVSSTKESH